MASVSFPTNVPVPTPNPRTQPAQPQQSLAQALEQAAFPVSDSTLLSGLREQEIGHNDERCLPDLKSWAGMDLTPQQELDLTVSQSMPRAQSDWADNMNNRDCRDVVDVNKDGVVDEMERAHADRVVDRHLGDQFDEVHDRAAVANIKEGKLESVQAEARQNADAINEAIVGEDHDVTRDRDAERAAGQARADSINSSLGRTDTATSTAGTDKKSKSVGSASASSGAKGSASAGASSGASASSASAGKSGGSSGSSGSSKK